MIPANLVINADDFGHAREVSRGIFYCVRHGLINSISVLPFDDPVQGDLLRAILSEYPDVRVGLHLSLIETPALHPDTPRYAGNQERPQDFLQFLRMYFAGRIRPEQALREWRVQVEWLQGHMGQRRIDHLDSHQHLHVLPGLWQAARRLQEEYGVARLRVPYESWWRPLFHRFPLGFLFQLLARLRFRQGDARFIGFMTSTRFSVEKNLWALRQVLRRPDIAFELMVHPTVAPERPEDHIAAVADGDKAERLREIEELKLLQFVFQVQDGAA